jgi:hypothetical protein
MPKALEQALSREASKKGLTGKHRNAYVYGTMREAGWQPKREKQASLKNKRKQSLDHTSTTTR